jgi:hypothetical protein
LTLGTRNSQNKTVPTTHIQPNIFSNSTTKIFRKAALAMRKCHGHYFSGYKLSSRAPPSRGGVRQSLGHPQRLGRPKSAALFFIWLWSRPEELNVGCIRRRQESGRLPTARAASSALVWHRFGIKKPGEGRRTSFSDSNMRQFKLTATNPKSSNCAANFKSSIWSKIGCIGPQISLFETQWVC